MPAEAGTRRPLRILAVGYATSTHVANRVRCFAERGHEVSLLTESAAGLEGVRELVPAVRPGQDEWAIRGARLAGRLLRRPGEGMADMARLMLDFRHLVRQADPDIVHVHYAYSGWAWMAGALGVRPLVVSIMGGDVLFGEQGSPTPRGIALTKQLLSAADLITAKSDYLIGVLDDIGGYGDKAMRVVWGIDPDVFRPMDAGPLRAEWNIPEDAQVVLSPKILQPFYNIDVLVAAMQEVLAAEPRAHLVVTEYGADPDYRDALKQQIRELGLEQQVIFVGHVPYEKMPLFYSLADVAVGIPSSDGLPQTLLEAMACGAPNIIGRLDRYGEIVRDRESALFADIEPGSVAEAILTLLRDAELRHTIVTNGRQIVVEQANFPNDVSRVEDAYYRLADQGLANRPPRARMLRDAAMYWMGR